MSPLERAQAIVDFADLRNADTLTDRIHNAIIEATNDELERRRQAERERDEALPRCEDAIKRASDADGKLKEARTDVVRLTGEPTDEWELADRLADALKRCRQGERNLLEFRRLSNGRYGNLTRDEIECSIAEINEALAAYQEARKA